MEVAFEPVFPYQWLALFFCSAAVLALLAACVKKGFRVLATRKLVRWIVFVFTAAAALLLALSAFNPVAFQTPETTRAHLCLALDVSESVLRGQNDWPRIQGKTADLLRNFSSRWSEGPFRETTASILTFGADTSVAEEKIPLAGLPEAVNELSMSRFAPGGKTDIEKALNRAAEAVGDAGGIGAVLLVSDGLQTDGDSLKAAKRLSREGIAVHVLPLESRGPALRIESADIPRWIDQGAGTWFRGSIFNGTGADARGSVELSVNTGLSAGSKRHGTLLASRLAFDLGPRTKATMREPIRFEGNGIQFADVILRSDPFEHRRRFFVYVHRPPKIMCIGECRWTSAVSPDTAEVVKTPPETLSEQSLADFDAVVFDSIGKNAFPAPETALQHLAKAVLEDGIGFFFINGDHGGKSPQTPTALADFKDTPVEGILPVSVEPRPFHIVPPERHVVLVMDRSGSMNGWKLQKSKEIAAHIVSNLLRDRDELHIYSFDTRPHYFPAGKMTPQGKAMALETIRAMTSGGGTSLETTLRDAKKLNLGDCGMVLLSDGFFNPTFFRPDCRATVFAVGHSRTPANSPLRDYADPFPVDTGFRPSEIQIPYFKPKKRDKYFEPGSFEPVSLAFKLPPADRLPVPAIPFPGAAVSYAKPESKLIAIRPKYIDPVLAYKPSGEGYCGILTSGVAPDWTASDEGRKALDAWLKPVLPFKAQKRYDFSLKDSGDRIQIQVALAPQNWRIPEIEYLTGKIATKNGDAMEIRFASHPEARGVFTGEATFKRDSETALQATLVLEEFGRDALARPQKLPFVIPPKPPRPPVRDKETLASGKNEMLLETIAALTNGRYDPEPETALVHFQAPRARKTALWPYLTAAAVLCYLGAICLQRFDP